jgi:thermitase
MPSSSSLSHWLAAAAIAVIAAPATATAAGRPAPTTRFLVKFDPGASPAVVARADSVAGAKVVQRLGPLGVQVLTVPRRRREAAVRVLRRNAHVQYVERDEPAFELGAGSQTFIPNDPLWSREWGLRRIDAPRAWKLTRGSPGVVIATLDSGVDFSHPDLAGALVPGRDEVDGDDVPSDDNGHGTAVAGLIAARADNALGISGVCPRCSVMPVKVTTAAGTASDSAVAAGLTWAVDHGARVVNISLGGTSFSQTIDAAVRYAAGKGTVIVSSAGNSGNSDVFYPAADDGVLGVAATDPSDRLYSWSNYGPWVDVAAPGCGLTTARGGLYEQFCGTSASAPVVSGLIALALSAGADPAAAVAAVSQTGRAVPGVPSGRVDAAATLTRLPGARGARASRNLHHLAVQAALRNGAVELRRRRR